MNTSATPSTSVEKNRRVPLAEINTRSAAATAALSRVLPSETRRTIEEAIFNSAL
ncbi:FXSXX-COOH protein [Streptomyces bambusae]|uniref:FxSxx-COOH cyclophane-containing RiPP peptide n=1 Tax=Streptomyces bambusae TaxID=1550616 RepID=UPI001CFE506D|nr:FxSxx-COOH cyclophane-containing RiPP peptide [Streptomyces bambusae]MCB5167103.1 FXSXX-COOH protein [Streptomyces bambusae]